ncbi:hypothetical protein Glove_25g13 [Diversispora epigaea]|uniref:Uncharacterized protein n=1 Tax=Diversispora epigaea TaxID=1348612 RepID=A0A397JIN0_9GLOM|nr:hypothetical protein Glove_25g13 [Diversispora epigaea]
MPALIFDWNDDGFNDDPSNPNCRNGVPFQTKETLIANLLANGATNYKNFIFAFENGEAIGRWSSQIPRWAKNQTGTPNVCRSIIRINFLGINILDDDGSTIPDDIEEFTAILG